MPAGRSADCSRVRHGSAEQQLLVSADRAARALRRFFGPVRPLTQPRTARAAAAAAPMLATSKARGGGGGGLSVWPKNLSISPVRGDGLMSSSERVRPSSRGLIASAAGFSERLYGGGERGKGDSRRVGMYDSGSLSSPASPPAHGAASADGEVKPRSRRAIARQSDSTASTKLFFVQHETFDFCADLDSFASLRKGCFSTTQTRELPRAVAACRPPAYGTCSGSLAKGELCGLRALAFGQARGHHAKNRAPVNPGKLRSSRGCELGTRFAHFAPLADDDAARTVPVVLLVRSREGGARQPYRTPSRVGVRLRAVARRRALCARQPGDITGYSSHEGESARPRLVAVVLKGHAALGTKARVTRERGGPSLDAGRTSRSPRHPALGVGVVARHGWRVSQG